MKRFFSAAVIAMSVGLSSGSAKAEEIFFLGREGDSAILQVETQKMEFSCAIALENGGAIMTGAIMKKFMNSTAPADPLADSTLMTSILRVSGEAQRACITPSV